MSTLTAAVSREQVEQLVRSILRKQAAPAVGRTQARDGLYRPHLVA
ncbi:MAG: hypothetical protein JOZ63_00420, partial [Planctomycetaceae bacterium]|nr:hypothetical protein [Planctomycetaceae bacterium]